MRLLRKLLKIYKSNGLHHGTKIVINKIKNRKAQLITKYDYITYATRESKLASLNGDISLLWFIPDFGIGSGGHLNIFRMIHNLEKLGIKSDIAICGHSQWLNEDIAKINIDKNFFKLNSKIYFIENESDIVNIKKYHIAMATSWETAYYVNSFFNCIKKLYFVQDFEPFFHAKGSKFSFAEDTYRFGFDGITAGSWLAKKLTQDYSMNCIPFSFSYDKNLYFNHKKTHNKKRVFFYARPLTERRGFELGILALNELYKRNKEVELVLAGGDISNYDIPFPHICMDVVPITELSDVYSQCDVALVLSFTNLSLLPLELLASGCEVLLNGGENNTWIDKEKRLFHYTDTKIENIVQGLSNILDEKTKKDKKYAEAFLSDSSWEKEAKIVYDNLQEKVSG